MIYIFGGFLVIKSWNQKAIPVTPCIFTLIQTQLCFPGSGYIIIIKDKNTQRSIKSALVFKVSALRVVKPMSVIKLDTDTSRLSSPA